MPGKLIASILIILCNPLCSLSQSKGHDILDTYLWEISGEDFKGPSYIYAILHTTDQRFLELEGVVKDKFNRCPSFSLITPLDVRERERLILEMQIRDRKFYKKTFDKNEYSRVDQFIEDRLGEGLQEFNNFNPLYLRNLLIDDELKEEKAKFTEDYLLDLAEKHYKQISALISIYMSSLIYEQIPLEDQAGILLDYVDNSDIYDIARENMLYFYTKRNYEAIRKIVEQTETPLYYEKFINLYNENIVRKIEQYSRDTCHFYAVNAAHIAGENGIISILLDKGYKIKPVLYDSYWSDYYIPTTIVFDVEDYPATSPGGSSESIEEADASPVPAVPEVEARQAGDTLAAMDEKSGLPGDSLEADIEGKALSESEGSGRWDDMALNKAYEDPFGDFFETEAVDPEELSTWYEIEALDGSFTVSMPYQPNLKNSAFQGENGIIDVMLYVLKDPDTKVDYLVSRNIYPLPFKLDDEQKFLDEAIKGASQQFGGIVLADRVSSTPLYAGREFVLLPEDGTIIRSRLYLIENKLYQVMLSASPHHAYSAYAREFFKSFALTNADIRQWYSITGTRYSLSMPSEPRQQSKEIFAQQGIIKMNIYRLQKQQQEYYFSISEYPPAFDPGKMKNFYRNIVNSSLNTFPGEVRNLETIKRFDVKGRSFDIYAGNSKRIYHFEVFLKDNFLYQIMASYEENKLIPTSFNYYFDSFKVY